MSVFQKVTFSVLVIYICGIVSSCGSVVKLNENTIKLTTPNTSYIVSNTIDLKGATLSLPEGCMLKFCGGKITNGTLVGKDTRIVYGSNREVFKDVKIEGTWIVPVIRSSMFSNTQKDMLENLFRLQNEFIHNSIYVQSGEYYVNANRDRGALSVKSNADVHIDGTIILESEYNEKFYNGYYILNLYKVRHVIVDGNGTLIGDKGRTTIKGEYGHAICVFGSDDVYIKGLSLKHMNGDGIAVSLGCKNIRVDDVYIEDYYRNAISVVDCDSFIWTNSTVCHGGEMPPYAAIDIEPNNGNTIDKVIVDNIKITDCGVGLAGYVNNNYVNTSVNEVLFTNIDIQDSKVESVAFMGIKHLNMSSVNIKNTDKSANYLMRVLDCDEVLLDNVFIRNKIDFNTYPLYLNNKAITIRGCSFESPKLFSFHLSNAKIENSIFKYNSFLHTSRDLPTSNLVIDNCTFEGPFEMFPGSVSITNSTFRTNDDLNKDIIKFDIPSSRKLGQRQLLFENNVIEESRGKTRLTVNPQLNATVKNNVVENKW